MHRRNLEQWKAAVPTPGRTPESSGKLEEAGSLFLRSSSNNSHAAGPQAGIWNPLVQSTAKCKGGNFRKTASGQSE